MVSVTIWIVIRFFNLFFEKKKKNIQFIFLWLLFFVFQVLVEYNKGTGSLVTFTINIILIWLISLYGYQKEGLKKILYVILLYVVWAIIEMIVFYSIISLPIKVLDTELMGSIISKLIVIIIINILSLNINKQYIGNIPMTYYFLLFFIPTGSIYIAFKDFYAETYNHYNLASMITFSILLLINIMIFEIYVKLSERFIIEKENIVYTQQMDIITRSTDEQKKLMEEFHEERHNLVNQLIVLKDNLERNSKEKVIKDLNNIIKICSTSENISNSGNIVIDAMLNFKYSIAKEKGIEFQLKIFIPDIIPINQYDLGIILGNAIDNAIEATTECKFHTKKIIISIGLKKESLIVVIKNPFEHHLKKDKSNKLISTKREVNKHGYGVNSLKRVAEKYHGDIIIESENNIFILTVILNIGVNLTANPIFFTLLD
jgi:hypothetical protein